MTERPAHKEFGRIAQKWRNLAERRRVHYTELYSSGRWKLSYTEEEFLSRIREVVAACERWATVAPDPASAPSQSQTQPGHRDAA